MPSHGQGYGGILIFSKGVIGKIMEYKYWREKDECIKLHPSVCQEKRLNQTKAGK